MAKTIAQIEAELKALETKQREEKNAVKARLARAQRAADEKVGKRLREAGATPAEIDKIVATLEAKQKPAQTTAPAKANPTPAQVAQKPATATPQQQTRPSTFAGALPKQG